MNIRFHGIVACRRLVSCTLRPP